jgi:hypothetical protein
MNPFYPVVASRAGNRCEYCRAPEAVFNFPFEVEHITPRSFGGTDSEGNLALACRACNLRKSNHLRGTDSQSGEEIRLFHPREDRWEEHFSAQVESGEITGTTAIGRATVVLLEMNNDVQVVARRHWLRLGLFP